VWSEVVDMEKSPGDSKECMEGLKKKVVVVT
jgi:hypothetical protein